MKSSRTISILSILIIFVGTILLISNHNNNKNVVSEGMPSGVHVSAGFQPESVSFVSSNLGYVLGSSTCKTGSCLTIARTADGGLTWKSIPAPVTSIMNSIPAPPNSISRIFFASKLEGYLYGPGLYATQNGGGSWHEIGAKTFPVGYAVSSVRATSSNVYVIGAINRSSSETKSLLYASKRGTSIFALQITPKFNLSSSPILSANSLGIVISTLDSKGRVFYLADGTSTWKSIAVNCASQFPNNPVVSIADPISGAQVPQLIALCGSNPAAGSEQKKILISENLSTFVSTTASPGLGGISQSIASPDGKTIAVAASSGATFLYTTRDSGKSWKIGLQDSSLGGAIILDLSFISTSEGFAMIGGLPLMGVSPKLIVTMNYGSSWQEMKVS